MLEADTRSVLLDGKIGRRIAIVDQATFLFATTRPAEMNRALRTRCTEIQLHRYTEVEVAQMIWQRFPTLTEPAVKTLAACSRLVPRIAFEIARDVLEEIKTSPTDGERACVKRVLNGRGILTTGGMTRDDVRYLKVLQREGRPVGERVIHSQLYDVDAQRISSDIEMYLMLMDYMRVTSGGRQLTYAGKRFLEDVAPTLNVE
jgi:Holliday junction resolvasome RuvABC ATP-dependent DNA helicase subunit